MRQEEKSALLTLRTVAFSEARDAVIILDQTQLPAREVYVSLRTAEDIWEAIYHLKVRGAPAIGIAAAYGIAVCMSRFEGTDREAFIREFKRVKAYLASSRPTAVNLSAALERMERALMKKADGSVEEWKELLMEEALAIREEDATRDIWPSRSMVRLWLRFIWARREVMASRSLLMRPGRCFKVPG